tara:strand:+ start:5473 stop:6906 length:1434 start_codon:yes stop_codon:yes gene_type:complete
VCGIVGIAGKIAQKERKIFDNLLTVCQLRGRDSTGVVSVTRGKEAKYIKQVGTPETLIDRKQYESIIGYTPAILIGHCRHTTSGSTNYSNAHPFDFDETIGVHNGTLAHSWNRGENAKDYTVDSEWLYSRIDEVGIEDALNDIDKTGAWALAFYRKDTNTLNFIRNSKRPLYFAWSKDKDTMFWASEPWMLCVVDRDIDMAVLNEETGAWYMPLPENTLWEIEVDATTNNKSKIFNMKPPREIEGGANFTFLAPPKKVTPPTGHGSTGSANKGGSGVIHPFQRTGAVDSTEEELATLLGLPAPTTSTKGSDAKADESTSSTKSEGKSQTSSQRSSGSTTGSKSTSSSRKGTLSLPGLSSPSSPTTSKRKPSSGSSEQSDSSTRESSPNLTLVHSQPSTWRGVRRSSDENAKNVSLRNVAGTWYISSLQTSMEISEKVFEENTNGVCAFCKTPIGGLEEVHTLLSRNAFICTDCGSGS